MAISVESYLGVPGSPVVVAEHTDDEGATFWDRLTAVAPWLRVERHRDGTTPRRTQLQGSGPHGRIVFVGHLEHRLLEPLVETLRALATGQIEFDTPATPSMLRGTPPLELVVVVGPRCPFCPQVAAAALRFACASPTIGTTILRADAGAPPEVRAVPTVLVGGRLLASGTIGEYALAARLTSSG